MLPNPMSDLHTLLQIFDQLQADCPEVCGVVLATAEGNLLAGRGSLGGDVAAAVSSYVMQMIDANLGLLRPIHSAESLIRTDEGLWYLCRLAQAWLAVEAEPMQRPALLMYAARSAAQRMLPIAETLVSPG